MRLKELFLTTGHRPLITSHYPYIASSNFARR